jgi:polyisoprenyl-phosphate glycosyltransferase
MALSEPSLDVSVVIPVYRSAGVLRELAGRLLKVLSETSLSHEVIFVNDDSPDEAWAVLGELHARHPDRITCVRLMRNFGQHNAVMCGFRRARGRYVVTMDDDLQHPPEEIPKLLAALDRGDLDVVYGSYDSKRHAALRNVGSWTLNRVFRRLFRVSTDFSSFRAIRREIVEAALAYELNFTFVDGLLAWNTTRIGSVIVKHAPRAQGKSGYSLRKLLQLSFNLLTNFSLLPLQLTTAMGMLASGFGLAAAIYYLVRALMGAIDVRGYASIISSILFLGGIQLLALGMIGEYIGRLHLNMNRKPQFREREVLEHSDRHGEVSGTGEAIGR